ncbi:unnamed protein product [Closterium sp. Yama58-4]|nr:unnamed protein product [Closterium sp. Yama58-4]
MRKQRVATSVLLRPSPLPDDLVFLRIIGQGRHATVWLCEDGRTGEQITCKKILKSTLRGSGGIVEAGDSSSATILARLRPSHDDVRREVAVTEGLSGKHPNILAFKGAFEEADAVYLTSEFCDSSNLLTYIVESAKRDGARAPDVYNLAGDGDSTAIWDDAAIFCVPARTDRGISRSISRTLSLQRSISRTLSFQRGKSGRKPPATPRKGDAVSRDVFGGSGAGAGGDGGWEGDCAWALPEADARAIFRQVAAAVQFCHQSGVAHGDIRLENVLLSSRRFVPGAAAGGPRGLRRRRSRSLPDALSTFSHAYASDASTGFGGDGLESPRAAPTQGGFPAVFAKLADFGRAESVGGTSAVGDAAAGDVAAAESSGAVASVASRIRDAVKKGSFGGKSCFGGEEGVCWMQYAAPELILSEMECIKFGAWAARQECPMKADVWSLGVVLFALLSSSVPFSGPHERRIFRQIAGARDHLEQLMFPSGDGETRNDKVWLRVSAEAKDLICSMLEIEPAARLSINDVVNHPWLNAKDITARRGIRGSMKCGGGLGSVSKIGGGLGSVSVSASGDKFAELNDIGEKTGSCNAQPCDFPPPLRRRNTFASPSDRHSTPSSVCDVDAGCDEFVALNDIGEEKDGCNAWKGSSHNRAGESSDFPPPLRRRNTFASSSGRHSSTPMGSRMEDSAERKRGEPVKCAGFLGSVRDVDAGGDEFALLNDMGEKIGGCDSRAEFCDSPPPLRRRSTFSVSSDLRRSSTPIGSRVVDSAERKGRHKRAGSVATTSATVNSDCVTSAGPKRIRGGKLMRVISQSIGSLAELSDFGDKKRSCNAGKGRGSSNTPPPLRREFFDPPPPLRWRSTFSASSDLPPIGSRVVDSAERKREHRRSNSVFTASATVNSDCVSSAAPKRVGRGKLVRAISQSIGSLAELSKMGEKKDSCNDGKGRGSGGHIRAGEPFDPPPPLRRRSTFSASSDRPPIASRVVDSVERKRDTSAGPKRMGGGKLVRAISQSIGSLAELSGMGESYDSCNAGKGRGSSRHTRAGETFDPPPPLRRRSTFSASSNRPLTPTGSRMVDSAERKREHKRSNSVFAASTSVNSASVTSTTFQSMRGRKLLMRTISRSIGSLADLRGLTAGNRNSCTPGAVSYSECDINFVSYSESNTDDRIGSSSSTTEGEAAEASANEAEAGAAEYTFSFQPPEGLGAEEEVIALGPTRGLRHRSSKTKGGEVPNRGHTAAADAAAGAAAGAAASSHTPVVGVSSHCVDCTAAHPCRALEGSCCDASHGSSHPAASTAFSVSSTPSREDDASAYAAAAAFSAAKPVRAWGRSYTDTRQRSPHALQSAYPFLSPQPSFHPPASPGGAAGGNPTPGHSSSGGASTTPKSARGRKLLMRTISRSIGNIADLMSLGHGDRYSSTPPPDAVTYSEWDFNSRQARLSLKLKQHGTDFPFKDTRGQEQKTKRSRSVQ